MHLRRLASLLPLKTAALWGSIQIIPSHRHGDISLVTDELQGGIKPPPAGARNEHLGPGMRRQLDSGRLDVARIEVAHDVTSRKAPGAHQRHQQVSEVLTYPRPSGQHRLQWRMDVGDAGLVLDADKQHIPFASLSGAVAERTVTLMSASKTFNVPTLGCAFAVASNPELRARMRRTMAGIVHHVGGLGYVATLAAYRDARAWQLELLDYLRGNRALVEQAIRNMHGLRTCHVEATYLAWIDARGLGVEDPRKFFEHAGVGLYDGALFGTPAFLRLNFACPSANTVFSRDSPDTRRA